MTQAIAAPFKNIEAQSSEWKALYQLSGFAALIMFVLIPIQIVVFIAFPPPQTVADYFALFQTQPLLGLLDLDLLLIVDNLLAIPLNLSFFVALRRNNASWVTVATLLGLFSILLYLVSREATFSMLTLSNQYAAAGEAQRQMFLAAGQVMLLTYNGTVFNISYILGAVGLIMMSLVMLRSDVFGKAAAWLGLAANIIALGLYIPSVGVYISVFSVVFLWVWDFLIALRLFRLSRAHPEK